MNSAVARPFVLIIGLAATALCAAVLTLAAIYLYLNPQIPDAATYRNVKLETPLRVLSRDGVLLAEYGERRLIPIDRAAIPDLFVRALVDTEDKRFFSHGGVDFISLVNDTLDLVLNREIVGGASTLTMQLARNVSFSLEQTFIRKFKEMLLAMKIERQLSKDEILALYINIVPFGKRAYGAEAAAQTYYGKSLNELSLAQLAMLAGVPQAPSTSNPINGPALALRRRNLVLSRMLAQGSITESEYNQAVDQPITAKLYRQAAATAAPYPAEIVRRELFDQFDDLYTGGYQVTTTLDSALQRRAIDALRRGLHGYDERHGYRGRAGSVELTLTPDTAAYYAGLLPQVDESADSATEEAVEAATTEASAEPEAAAQNNDIAAPDSETLASLVDVLDDYPRIGAAQPGLILATNDQNFTALLDDGSSATVAWDGMSWGRRFLSVERRGPSPKRTSDLLQVGDVAYLRGDGDGWRLAQEPDVQGALVSIEPRTGAIRALTGGYDFARNQYNHATQAKRQPGSGFKPFVYSAALDAGVTPSSIFMDAPIVLDDELLETQYRPDNNNKRYNGPTRLREALYRSINLVSIRVLLEVGAGRVLRHVDRFGFNTSQFPRNTQLGVGGGTMGVSPLQMARAYSVFANGGYLVEPYLIDRVEKDGEVLFTSSPTLVCEDCEREPSYAANDADGAAADMAAGDPARNLNATAQQPTGADDPTSAEDANAAAPPAPMYADRVLDSDNAFVMHTMLQDVIRRGTGRRALQLERSDLAGKTGTTNEAADTWFNGYQDSLVTTVWVGFSDYRPLGPREFGATTPLPIWIDYMQAALREAPSSAREQPETVISLKIDPETGRMAQPGDRAAIFEYFLDAHRPEPPEFSAPLDFELDEAGGSEEIDTTDLF
ncbi:MAG: PBP1A family penicillin-binding protein [Pseudomonadota bacterium]